MWDCTGFLLFVVVGLHKYTEVPKELEIMIINHRIVRTRLFLDVLEFDVILRVRFSKCLVTGSGNATSLLLHAILLYNIIDANE